MNLAVRYEDDAADRRHVPVMVEEVCGLLSHTVRSRSST